MDRKKFAMSSLILTILLSLIPRAIANSNPQKTRVVYSIDHESLLVEIWAPYLADLGQKIDVTVKVEAKADIYVEYMYVEIYGLKNMTVEKRLRSIEHIYNKNLTNGERLEGHYPVIISRDISPGLTYGRTEYKWTVKETTWSWKSGFPVTYVKSKEYEKLHEDYLRLNATYNNLCDSYIKLYDNYTKLSEDLKELEANYTGISDDFGRLEANYTMLYNNFAELNNNYTALYDSYTELELKHEASSSELGGARNVMYVLIVTTVISATTAVFFAIKRPKKE